VRFLQIKQAQTALKDGRLDEAFELLRNNDLTQQRAGQELIGKVARALAGRGREHLENKRFSQARADCDKAEKLAGNLPEVAHLHSDISQAVKENHNEGQQRNAKLNQARQYIDNGWLSAGQQMLGDGDNCNADTHLLLQQARTQRLKINDIVSALQSTLERNDLESALELLRQAQSDRVLTNHSDPRLTDLIGRLINRVYQQVRQAVNEGRLDQAQGLLDKVEPVANDSLEYTELYRVLQQCQTAGQYLRKAGRIHLALRVLRRLKTMIPVAKWLDRAIADAQNANSSLDELAEGPLGLIVNDSQNDSHDPTRRQHPGQSEVNRDYPEVSDNEEVYSPADSPELPGKFAIQVDGAGSFLVLRQDRVKVGPISSTIPVDVAVIAEPQLPVAHIERMEGDYFLRSTKAVKVNDQATMEKLLSDGDRISLSQRIPIKFRLPNAASATAVLDLTSVRTPQTDMRHAILLAGEILLGPGSANHIRNDKSSRKVVLVARQGRLYYQGPLAVQINGHPWDVHRALPMEKSIEIDDVCFVLTGV